MTDSGALAAVLSVIRLSLMGFSSEMTHVQLELQTSRNLNGSKFEFENKKQRTA